LIFALDNWSRAQGWCGGCVRDQQMKDFRILLVGKAEFKPWATPCAGISQRKS
jgi:hypothetical protein